MQAGRSPNQFERQAGPVDRSESRAAPGPAGGSVEPGERGRAELPAQTAPEELVALTSWTRLFDPDWYIARYPDVAKSGQTPEEHFDSKGAVELRDPNPWFDSARFSAQQLLPGNVNHSLRTSASNHHDVWKLRSGLTVSTTAERTTLRPINLPSNTFSRGVRDGRRTSQLSCETRSAREWSSFRAKLTHQGTATGLPMRRKLWRHATTMCSSRLRMTTQH